MRSACRAVPGAFLLLGIVTSAWAGSPADLKAIVDKAVKAVGGEAKLAKFKAATWKTKGTVVINDEIPFAADWTVQGPAHSRIDADVEVNGQSLLVVLITNGDESWIKVGDTTVDRDKDQLAEDRERAYLNWLTALLPLTDKSLKLAPLGELKIDDQLAVGLLVSCKGHRDVNLFFDKKTGRLLKSETRVKDLQSGVERTQEGFYSNYKEMDGAPRPTRVAYKRDNKPYLTLEISDFKLHESVDDNLFAKP